MATGGKGYDHRALEALAGADYVREKLVATLTVGPNDLSRRIYAIKCRVKSESRLIAKVEDRRQKKPAYTALDATDIVGLRLVCIFTEELPAVVSEFLEYVAFMQDPRIALFAGSSLGDAISEVIVYASMSGTSIYKSIFDNLHSRFADDIAKGKTSVSWETPTEDLPYSSIHIICRAKSYYAETPKNIPIEVQIRTTFEDIWSEIEHPRGYKGPNFADKYGDNPILHGMAKNITRRLNNLKKSLEAAAEQAEDIGRDFNTLTLEPGSDDGILVAKQANMRVVSQHRISAEAPSDIVERLASVERAFGEIYDEIFDDTPVHNVDEIKSITVKLVECIDRLDRLAKDYESRNMELFFKDNNFMYYRHSESGLARYWIARLMKGFLDVPSGERSGEVATTEIDGMSSVRQLDRALEEYFILRDHRDEVDALLSFRIATALVLQGQGHLALEKCREAYLALQTDTRLPKDNIFRAVIPRGYAYNLWRQAQRLRESATTGQAGMFDAKAREAIKKSIEVTIYARENYLVNLKGKNFDDEQSTYQNNILNFLATYVELNGSLKDFGDLADRGKLLADADDLKSKFSTVPSRLDTCVRAYLVLQEPQRAKETGEALSASLDRDDLARHYTPADIAYMRETVRMAKGEGTHATSS